jgi:hypothetical protein
MRFVLTIICMTLALPAGAVAQQTNQPPAYSSASKSIVITTEFCDACRCCEQQSASELGIPVNSEPRTFVLKRSVAQVLKNLQSSSNSPSTEVMHDLATGAGMQGLAGICNACGCCTETERTIMLTRPASTSDLNEFQVFNK